MNRLWRLVVVVFLWVVKISTRSARVSRFRAILTKIQCQYFESVFFETVELLQFLAQTLGQNRPKALKSKRSRRELSNGVVESLIRRDLTPGLAKTRVLHFLVVFCLFLGDKTKHVFKCACFGNSATGTNLTEGSSRTTENGSARAGRLAGRPAAPGQFWGDSGQDSMPRFWKVYFF